MLRFLTAGESHGKGLVAILEGMVANLAVSSEYINKDLARRQLGYGRGDRMNIEKDEVEILSGVRSGKTIGSPISLLILNKDYENQKNVTDIITKLRPGHADLAGIIKYNQYDIRNILERASARETAARVAVGAVCKIFLNEFKINISSRVLEIGGFSKENDIKAAIDKAREGGDSLGGIFEVSVENAPIGLGSHAHWDRRLDTKLAGAVMGVPAVKGVEIGLGFGVAKLAGSKVHDEIFFKNGNYGHNTNNAGGIEGGMSNGEPIIIRAAMKPIATLRKPLQSVDIATKKPVEAHVERADVCAVESAAVIGESVAAIEIANAMLEKFGGDCLEETKNNFSAFCKLQK